MKGDDVWFPMDMKGDDVWFSIGVVIGLGIAISIMANVVDTTVSKEQIEIAQKLCGDRQIEWVSPTTLKCEDGARYEDYSESPENP